MPNGTLGNYDRQEDGTRNISGFVTGRVLAATTAESMAIPTSSTTGCTSRAKRVIISSDQFLCVDFAKTAVVPADDDTGVKSAMIAPNSPVESRTFIVPADTAITNLSVIAMNAGGANVTAEWFY